MKIYNDQKDKILEYENLDFTKGYLKDDTIYVAEVKGVEEKGHYETIKEYSNGGKDVKWVVDVEGTEYCPEHEEKIKVYVFYTNEELQTIQKTAEIEQLKRQLFDTDYQAIKFAEGETSVEDYEQIKVQRREWRVKINELEEEIETLKK